MGALIYHDQSRIVLLLKEIFVDKDLVANMLWFGLLVLFPAVFSGIKMLEKNGFSVQEKILAKLHGAYYYLNMLNVVLDILTD